MTASGDTHPQLRPSACAPTVIVLAKEPRAGRAKTRLTPPLSPQSAAAVAEASLRMTLSAVTGSQATHVVVALEGACGGWLPGGVAVIQQRGARHAARIEHAFADAGCPAFLVGMDSPQLTAAAVDNALAHLARPHVDAVLGLAADGGWWGLGLNRLTPGLFDEVVMSRADTGLMQARRLDQLGLRVVRLPMLRDLDTIEDARLLARQLPGSLLARTLREVDAVTAQQR